MSGLLGFFIGTMLNQTVESVEMKPQEFTYHVIKTSEGQRKKVLIEIQKASNQMDLMRFRNYLAEQYKKQDVIEGEKQALPITTIYILGFKLNDIKSACIRVERQYRDLVEGRLLEEKSDFVEKLTHDSYVVQVRRITDRFKTPPDKLLSVFEQAHFVDDSEIIKEYLYEADAEELKMMTDILHHSGTDPETKKKVEDEQEAWRSVNALFEDKERAYQKALEEKNQLIEELRRKLREK